MGSNSAWINAEVITMTDEAARAEGILIEDGVITFVGDSKETAALAKEKGIEITDLNGCCVLPGLHDCHAHVMGTGMAMVGVDLYDCASVKEVLEALAEEGKRHDEGWVCGVRLDESRLAEKRPPTLAELSGIFPDRGVYILDRGLHYTLVNRKAYEEIGLTGKEKGLCRGEDGKPNGRMHEEANKVVRGYFNDSMTDAQRETAIRNVEKEALKKGITTIHAMEGGEMFSDKDIDVFESLKGKTDVDFVIYWDTLDLDQVIERGYDRVGTDNLSDGSIGSRTAAFDEPYADDPSTCGLMYLDKAFMTEWIGKALKNHIQCGFHAIGQKAIRHVIDCYEEAYAGCPWEDARFRIEHFGFCDDRDIERAVKNKIIISTQPSFSYLRGGPGSVYQIRTGPERERRAYPNKKFLDYGAVLAGGSDSNVTPIDALLGIHAAVNHPYPEHRISVYQALRMFTIDGAYSAFEEKKKGTIEAGKLGDLTILSKSPYEAAPDAIKDIRVVRTVKEGRTVYCG
ncbi:MAG: amidohydrolase [Eubacterium sp.]|nr:amidohydrolase [Eubacterium sp.]